MLKAFGFRFFAEDQTKAALSNISAGLRDLASQAERTTGSIGKSNVVMLRQNNVARQSGRSMGNFGHIFGNVGNQVADTAVMMEMGMDPMRALTQQGSQMLAAFGPMGAVMGAAVAVFGTLGIIAMKTSGDLQQLASVAGVLTPAFTALGSAMQTAFGWAIDAGNLLVNNLDRVLIAGGVVAAFYGGRWLAAFIAAGGATTALTGALGLLRFALLRLPFVALVVAATELIYQFIRLVQGAGSFGEALSILAAIGSQAFERLKQAGIALGYELQAVAYQIQAGFLESFQTIYDLASKLAVDLPSMLPAGVLDALGWIGIEPATKQLGGVATALDKARHMADSFGNSAALAWGEASKPIDTSGLTTALQNAKDTAVDLRDVFGGTGGGEETVGGSAAGAADKAEKAIKKGNVATVDWVRSVRDLGDNMGRSLGDGLNDIVRGTEDWREAMRNTAADVIGQLWDILVTQRLVAAAMNAISGRPGTSGTGILGGLLSRVGWTPTPRASGGPVTAGHPYMVGESGRELFIPEQSGRIDPNPKGAGGSVVVNQTINLSVGVRDTVRAEVAAMLPQLAQMSREAVYTAQRRGKPV